MPLFLIERNFAEAVQADPETTATVTAVNDDIGIQWLFSFLSADKRKTYCLYEAPNAEAIRTAARRLGRYNRRSRGGNRSARRNARACSGTHRTASWALTRQGVSHRLP